MALPLRHLGDVTKIFKYGSKKKNFFHFSKPDISPKDELFQKPWYTFEGPRDLHYKVQKNY